MSTEESLFLKTNTFIKERYNREGKICSKNIRLKSRRMFSIRCLLVLFLLLSERTENHFILERIKIS